MSQDMPAQRGLQQVSPYYVQALAMALPAIMLGLQISAWIFFLPGALHGHADFRHLYAAAYMIRTGHRGEIYNYEAEQKFQDSLVSSEEIALPFNHLAYEALLFLPYSYASYQAGYFLFLLTNSLLLLIALRVMWPWTTGLRALFAWLPTALFVSFLPVPTAFMQGQDSIILLLLFAIAFTLVSRKNDLAAGTLVGLGLFKFQIAVPIAALFFLWKKWRFLAGFALSSILILAASVWLAGPEQISSYGRSLLSMSVQETALDQARFAIYPIGMPNLRGLIYVLTASWLARVWVQALTITCSFVVLLWVALVGKCRNGSWQFLLAITAAAFLSYHIYIHDLSILLIPLAVILSCYSPNSPERFMYVLSAVLFSAPAIVALSAVHPFVLSIPLLLFLLGFGRLKQAPDSFNSQKSLRPATN